MLTAGRERRALCRPPLVGQTAVTVFERLYAQGLVIERPGQDAALALSQVRGTAGTRRNGVWQFAIRDHLGNERVRFDQNGQVLERNHHYAYGLRHPGWSSPPLAASEALYAFAGGTRTADELAVQWQVNGARLYDPVLGRFLGVEPLADKYVSLSVYAYAANDPVNFKDASGLNAETARDSWWGEESATDKWRREEEERFLSAYGWGSMERKIAMEKLIFSSRGTASGLPLQYAINGRLSQGQMYTLSTIANYYHRLEEHERKREAAAEAERLAQTADARAAFIALRDAFNVTWLPNTHALWLELDGEPRKNKDGSIMTTTNDFGVKYPLYALTLKTATRKEIISFNATRWGLNETGTDFSAALDGAAFTKVGTAYEKMRSSNLFGFWLGEGNNRLFNYYIHNGGPINSPYISLGCIGIIGGDGTWNTFLSLILQHTGTTNLEVAAGHIILIAHPSSKPKF